MRLLPTRRRRIFSALLLPLLIALASIATASPAAAGSVTSTDKPVGTGANRYMVAVTWVDKRPASGVGRAAVLSMRSASGMSCNSSEVASVWVRRIQAGTENILASGPLNDWDRCHNVGWWLDRNIGGPEAVQQVTGCWACDANLWSGPGGSPSPTNKQEIRIYLFDSSGHQIDSVVGYPYPG